MYSYIFTNSSFYILQHQLGNFNYTDQKLVNFALHVQQKSNIQRGPKKCTHSLIVNTLEQNDM
jgi:hypothetical protein